MHQTIIAFESHHHSDITWGVKLEGRNDLYTKLFFSLQTWLSFNQRLLQHKVIVSMHRSNWGKVGVVQRD